MSLETMMQKKKKFNYKFKQLNFRKIFKKKLFQLKTKFQIVLKELILMC